MQYTVSCQSCSDKHGSPPYVDTPSPTSVGSTQFQPQQAPANCPRCGRTRSARPYDWADILCQTYFGLTRQSALQVLAVYSETRRSGNIDNLRQVYEYTTLYDLGTTAHPQYQVHKGTTVLVNERRQSVGKALTMFKQSHDVLDYLKMIGANVLLQRGYTAPIDCTCRSCGGQFTYIRGIVDVQRDGPTNPAHCIWCGSTSLIQDPEQTEDTAWTVLSINYKLPVHIIKTLYDQYSKSISYSSFASYMASPDVQKVLTILSKTTQPVSA